MQKIENLLISTKNVIKTEAKKEINQTKIKN